MGRLGPLTSQGLVSVSHHLKQPLQPANADKRNRDARLMMMSSKEKANRTPANRHNSMTNVVGQSIL